MKWPNERQENISPLEIHLFKCCKRSQELSGTSQNSISAVIWQVFNLEDSFMNNDLVSSRFSRELFTLHPLSSNQSQDAITQQVRAASRCYACHYVLFRMLVPRWYVLLKVCARHQIKRYQRKPSVNTRGICVLLIRRPWNFHNFYDYPANSHGVANVFSKKNKFMFYIYKTHLCTINIPWVFLP